MLNVTNDQGKANPNHELTPPSPRHSDSFTEWKSSRGSEDVEHTVTSAVTPEGCLGAPPHVYYRVTAPYMPPNAQPREMKTCSHKHLGIYVRCMAGFTTVESGSNPSVH